MAFISPVNQMTTADALRLASLAAYGNNKALQDLLVAMISGNVAVLPGSSTAGGGVTVRSGGNIYSNAGAAIQGNAAVTTNALARIRSGFRSSAGRHAGSSSSFCCRNPCGFMSSATN